MIEFIVIGESRADADIATKLAERILVEKIDWLEPEYLQYSFRWSGLQENTGYSCWRDIEKIIDDFQQTSILRIPKYKRSRETQAREPLKPDAARAIKVLNLVRFLQRTRGKYSGDENLAVSIAQYRFQLFWAILLFSIKKAITRFLRDY
jgi:hypothetical protein